MLAYSSEFAHFSSSESRFTGSGCVLCCILIDARTNGFALSNNYSYSLDCSINARVLVARDVPANNFSIAPATTSVSCATSMAALSQEYSAASRQRCSSDSVWEPMNGRARRGVVATLPSVRYSECSHFKCPSSCPMMACTSSSLHLSNRAEVTTTMGDVLRPRKASVKALACGFDCTYSSGGVSKSITSHASRSDECNSGS
mmetsp:Transcript_34368/g.75237  ORF Transcript_34368/g.75237 Transcript_34368/m.75237 type:complete len:202 (+) Transcript_34368:126-731(+)